MHGDTPQQREGIFMNTLIIRDEAAFFVVPGRLPAASPSHYFFPQDEGLD